jgi:hypothetical protein
MHAHKRRKALKKTKRSHGPPKNKYQASTWDRNIYAAFVNMTMALPMAYTCFYITLPVLFPISYIYSESFYTPKK